MPVIIIENVINVNLPLKGEKKMKKIFIFIVLAAFIFVPVGYADSFQTQTAEVVDGNIYVTVEGKAGYHIKGDKFHIADTVETTTLTNLDSIDYDMNLYGGGYEIKMGTIKNKPLGFEVSFEQAFSLFKERKDLPGEMLYNTAIMGIIDNSVPNGSIILNADYPGLTNPFDGYATLKYDLTYYAGHINVVKNIIQKDHMHFDILAGASYANFTQNFRLLTVGQHPLYGTTTNVGLAESLTDNLFGGLLGIKGGMEITKNLSLVIKETVDLFYRHTKMRGEQSVCNALLATADGEDFTGKFGITRADDGFTPHFVSKTGLCYNITKSASFNLFYQFDLWGNLTRIDNPRAKMADSGAGITVGTAEIVNENFISHTLGASVNVRF